MFKATLFTVAKRWNDLNECISNVVYTYDGIYYSMDEPWGHYAKLNKPEIKGQILYDSIYMRWNRIVKIPTK